MILGLICLLLTIFWLLLLVRVVLSWVPRPPDPLAALDAGLRRVTDPVVEPVRRVVPPVRFGSVALDMGVLVVFLGVAILQGIICR